MRTERRGSARRLCVLACAASLVLASCASDDADDTASTPTTESPTDESPTTEAATDTDPSDLRVSEDGVEAPMSEALADAGELAFSEVPVSGAVMAVRTPEGTWIASIGTTERDGTEPIEAVVNQRIGSITKTYVVTALLQLADDDELSLDDPIGDYIDDIPNPDATLGQLASMQSGIPSYTFDEQFQETLFEDPVAPWTPEELIDVVRDTDPDFAPGEEVSYSNTNLVLLGMVIEQVTEMPLDQVIEDQIAEPLGLSATFFPTDASYPEPHARGYTMQGQEDEPADATDWNPSWAWAAGSMISTVEDLLVYGEELVAGDTLLSESMQAARIDSFDFDVPPNSPERAYGLGLGLANGWYGHTGELPGFNTVLQHHLIEGITVVVLVNSDIVSGDCPGDAPVDPTIRTVGPCANPAVYIGDALTAALGLPLVEE